MSLKPLASEMHLYKQDNLKKGIKNEKINASNTIRNRTHELCT